MKAYIYDWSYEIQQGISIIRMFCLDENNHTVTLVVRDFLPFCYIELPDHVTVHDLDDNGVYTTFQESILWDDNTSQLLTDALVNRYLRNNTPVSKSIEYRKKLYYTHKDNDMNDIYFPYLLYHFRTNEYFSKLKYTLNTTVNVAGIGQVVIKPREMDIDPIIQFVCVNDLYMTGWIEYTSTEYTDCNESIVSSSSISRSECTLNTPTPTILSFDIECYSGNPNRFPDASEASDCVFQISCVFWTLKKTWKILLTMGVVEEDIVCEDDKIDIHMYDNEALLFMGFIQLIKSFNPHVITGWNILGFDIHYMIRRSKLLLLENEFLSIGMIKDKICPVIDNSWTSAQYGKQMFNYFQLDGRIIIDLLIFARREIKSENYKLETIASMFVNAHKDPLTAKDIFRGFDHGFLRASEFGLEGRQLLSEVGKYCVKDSILVQLLFDEFDMWTGLTESAAVFNIPCSYIYTHGQQIKVFAQVYRYCYNHRFVVEQDVYVCKKNERYMGAYVKEPIPGLYNHVVTMDFASLYPTIMISRNIDYSTLVMDDKIPDSACHVIEWTEEHDYDIHICKHCNQRTRGDRSDVRNKTINSTFVTTIDCEHCLQSFTLTFEDIKNQCTIIGGDYKLSKRGDKLSPHTEMFVDSYRYRFIKEPKGIIPTIAENLLNARKGVRKQIAALKKSMIDTDATENIRMKNLINILDKRQLSFKVACNSLYGILGVRKGKLPLMPGAMCTTSIGRSSLHQTGEHLVKQYGVNWVYGDTDSVMVQFPNVEPKDLWEFSLRIEQELASQNIFPKPMYIEFENIYDPFFILSKKRYMWRYYRKDGSHSEEIGNKGVVLARRGSSKFFKKMYETLVAYIFDGRTKEQAIDFILERLHLCSSSTLPIEDFVLTKKIRDVDSYCSSQELPAHVQVAKNMRMRGECVDVGQRVEYVITVKNGLEARVFEKAEDVVYQQRYSRIIPIDHLYYIHSTVKQVDEMLQVAFRLNDFMKKQYEIRVKKYKLLFELKRYFRSTLTFVD